MPPILHFGRLPTLTRGPAACLSPSHKNAQSIVECEIRIVDISSLGNKRYDHCDI